MMEIGWKTSTAVMGVALWGFLQIPVPPADLKAAESKDIGQARALFHEDVETCIKLWDDFSAITIPPVKPYAWELISHDRSNRTGNSMVVVRFKTGTDWHRGSCDVEYGKVTYFSLTGRN